MSKIQQLAKDETKFNSAWKEYHYALEFAEVNEECYRIYASGSPTSLVDKDCRFKYSMKFVIDNMNRKMMIWSKLDKDLKNVGSTRSTELYAWEDLKHVAEIHFAKLLDLWGNKYSALLKGEKFELNDKQATRDIENEYIPKKLFSYDETDSTIFYHHVERLGQNTSFHDYPNFIYAPFNPHDVKLSQLASPGIHISIGDQSEEEILDLIETWKMGMVRDNFQYVKWRLIGSEFDRKKLVELLNADFNESGPIKIKQYKKTGRVGRLYHNETELGFISDPPISGIKKVKVIVICMVRKMINFPRRYFDSQVGQKMRHLKGVTRD